MIIMLNNSTRRPGFRKVWTNISQSVRDHSTVPRFSERWGGKRRRRRRRRRRRMRADEEDDEEKGARTHVTPLDIATKDSISII
jgi:hypothetical protein